MKNWAKNHQKPTATAFCINIHNLTKYAICMHKENKTLEKGYKYTRPTFHYTHPFRRMFSIVEKSPAIFMWIVIALFVITGIIDTVVTMGFFVPEEFLNWFIWAVIGGVLGGITYFVTKLSVCYKVMVICNFEDICETEKLLAKKLEEISATEKRLSKILESALTAAEDDARDLSELRDFKKLLDEKIISEEEFDNAKKRILKQSQ